MSLYYHGTNLDGALGIAKYGAILSRWDQEILRLQFAAAEGQDLHLTEGETVEALALRLASSPFHVHEIEHRVKCVSISKSIRVPIMTAAVEEKRGLGGVVLGFEFSEVPKGYETSSTIYVPRKVSIDGLKELHITRDLSPGARKNLEQAFVKYSHKYIFTLF